MFKIGDVNGDGTLDASELQALLGLSGLKLSDSKIAAVMEIADVNKDGVIQYEEFIPVMLSALKAKESLKASDYSSDELNAYLTALFQIGDANNDGVLQPVELKRLLTLCGLNLSARAVRELMFNADVNGDGVIQYEEFVPLFQSLIKDMQQIKPATTTPEMERREIDPDVMDSYLLDLFTVADKNRDGVLELAELEALLSMSGFNFSAREVEAVLASAELNSDGVVEYEGFIPIARQLLIKLGVPQTTVAKTESDTAAKLRIDDYSDTQLQIYLQELPSPKPKLNPN